MRARKDEHEVPGLHPRRANTGQGPRFDASSPSASPSTLLELQRLAGNSAVGAELARSLQRQEDDVLSDEPAADVEVGGADAEEAQSGSRPQTKAQARALVDGHVQPRSCFIVFRNNREGWAPIPGTGCAHWVAHQRGGPSGGANACQDGFKYRVTEVLASLSFVGHGLAEAAVGRVWSWPGHSHMGIVREVQRNASGTIVSVSVENDSSAAGGVVTQTKTEGDFYE